MNAAATDTKAAEDDAARRGARFLTVDVLYDNMMVGSWGWFTSSICVLNHPIAAYCRHRPPLLTALALSSAKPLPLLFLQYETSRTGKRA